jgi:hypothetical protein
MSRNTPVERWNALKSSSNESDINDILKNLSVLSEKESHQIYRNWYETQEVRERYPRNFFNIVDNKGQTLLHKIAESSNLNVTVMNKLIEEYVQAMNRSAYTKSMMQLKLDMDTKTQYYEPVDINIKDNEGNTPLILVIQTKKSDKIKYLLSRPDISVDCFMLKMAIDKQLDKAIILQIISKINLELDCPQEISQAALTAVADEKGFYKADNNIITALEVFMANKSEQNYIVSAPNSFEKIKRSAGVTIMHTNNAIAKMAKPVIVSVKTQLPNYLKTIIESSYSGAKPVVIGTAQFSYYVLFLFVGLMVANYINNIAILLIQSLENFIYNSYSEITQLISQSNGYIEILNSFIELLLNIIDPRNYIKLLDIPGDIVFLTRIISTFGSGIYKSLGYLYNNNKFILSFQQASNSFIEFIPEIQDYPGLVILFAILGTLYFLYTFYEETSNQVEIPTSNNPSKQKIGRYLSPSRNKKGGGKINNLDDVLKIFTDKTPGLDEFVDDILQYVVDIIGTIDKSDLDQMGIKPEDISQINVEYIKNINFNQVKGLKMPIEFYQDIYMQIRDVKGQFEDIKTDAEARLEQMKKMEQSEADVRYGNPYKQEIMGFNAMGPMAVGSMGGKQKRSRRKHNKSKSVKRKHSRRKRSRRKNRK